MVFLRSLSLLRRNWTTSRQSINWVSFRHFPSPECSIKNPSSSPRSRAFSLFPSTPQPPAGPERNHTKNGSSKPSSGKRRWQKEGGAKKAGSFGSAAAFPAVDVSPGMAALIGCLHRDGYLTKDSFWKERFFDPGRVHIYEHSMGSLKFAVEQFGRRHQETAKWLSGKHIKEVSLLGCPSMDRKTVYAAKSLRSFFRIQEDSVCKTCKLRGSCKFPNKSTGRREKLVLVDVLIVLIGYSLPSPTSQHQMLADGMKLCIDKILTNAVSLSS